MGNFSPYHSVSKPQKDFLPLHSLVLDKLLKDVHLNFLYPEVVFYNVNKKNSIPYFRQESLYCIRIYRVGSYKLRT